MVIDTMNNLVLQSVNFLCSHPIRVKNMIVRNAKNDGGLFSVAMDT